jgi:hypothetical protein
VFDRRITAGSSTQPDTTHLGEPIGSPAYLGNTRRTQFHGVSVSLNPAFLFIESGNFGLEPGDFKLPENAKLVEVTIG